MAHESTRQTHDQPTPSPLCHYLDELVDSMRKDIPSALKEFDEDAIHDTRVATRRLKAALELLQPVLSDDHRKPVAKVGKRLRRRLGPMRDLDVMLESLSSLTRVARHRPAAEWLQKRLTDARDEARSEAKAETSTHRLMGKLGSWWGLREEIDGARDAADQLLAKSLNEQLDAFSGQAQALRQRRPGDHLDPHQLRIAGKALRYTLEMGSRQGFALEKDVAKTFKKFQDALGRWHDLVVLTERAMQESIDALLPHHDPELQKQVMALAKLLLDRSVRELAHFSEMWAAKGEKLVDTIRRAVPGAVPISGLQTVLDLPGSDKMASMETPSPAESAVA